MSARKTVVVFLLGTMVLITVDNLSKKQAPAPRQYVGAVVAYTILAFGAEFAPQVAGPLAALVFFSSLFAHGAALGKVLK